jgi:hypothetical protein
MAVAALGHRFIPARYCVEVRDRVVQELVCAAFPCPRALGLQTKAIILISLDHVGLRVLHHEVIEEHKVFGYSSKKTYSFFPLSFTIVNRYLLVLSYTARYTQETFVESL